MSSAASGEVLATIRKGRRHELGVIWFPDTERVLIRWRTLGADGTWRPEPQAGARLRRRDLPKVTDALIRARELARIAAAERRMRDLPPGGAPSDSGPGSRPVGPGVLGALARRTRAGARVMLRRARAWRGA